MARGSDRGRPRPVLWALAAGLLLVAPDGAGAQCNICNAGIELDPAAGLSVTEDGDATSFRIRLRTAITGRTTIPLASTNPAEGKVYPDSVTFLPGNWDRWQEVYVAGVQDSGQTDGDQTFRINVGPADSFDIAYDSLSASPVTCINEDDDQAGVVLSQYDSIRVSEGGNTALVTIRLQTQPTGAVTVNARSGDTTEATVNPATMEFGPGTWNVRQTLTITGADDNDVDGDVGYRVLVEAGGSADPNYDTWPTQQISARTLDNDRVGIEVNDLSVRETTEWGGEGSFLVSLRSMPAAPVTLNVASQTAAEGVATPAVLTFESTNWDIPQTVSVTGQDDMADDGDVAYDVRVAIGPGTAAGYAMVGPRDVRFTNVDDDPTRDLTCDTYTDPNTGAPRCLLQGNALGIRCDPGTGCDDATCCVKCDVWPQSKCPTRQWRANYANVACPATGCDISACCTIPPAPQGAGYCTSYTRCQLVGYPERIWCGTGGCSDEQCCTTCASFDTSQCATGFLRVEYDEVSCPVDGCTAELCCRPDPCFGVQCTPPSQCHQPGTCDPGTGLCMPEFKPATSRCDDALANTINDQCNGRGVCSGESRCASTTCAARSSCHADGACDQTSGLCTEPLLQNGIACDDGNADTTNDVCDSGACVGSIVCGTQTCETTAPECMAVQCGTMGGTSNQPGLCIETPKADGTPCDDRDPTTFDDKCTSGVCKGRDLCVDVVCTAVKPCFAPGTCDPATGICTTPLVPDGTLCDDGDDGTVGDRCALGECLGRSRCNGVICTQTSPCRQPGVCDPADGLCKELNTPVGTACDDFNFATSDDTCDGSGNCVGTLMCDGSMCMASEPQCHSALCQNNVCTETTFRDGTPCFDGDPLTFDDKCMDGRCMGELLCTSKVCRAQHQCHLQGVCEPASGQCSTVFQPDMTPCNDGNDATKNDMCRQGECVGEAQCAGVTCVARTTCHIPGTCDPLTGLCSTVAKPDGTRCDDSDTATSNDMCVAGVCIGSVMCGGFECAAPASEPCRTATCSADARCMMQDRADGTACDDGVADTLDDVCRAGVCVGVSKCADVVCAGTDPCRAPGACNPATGICEAVGLARPDGEPCDDGDDGTRNDVCTSGMCVGVPLCKDVQCVPPDQCHTAGVCSAVTGSCTSAPRPDNTPCNDGNAATTDDKCRAGACTGTVTCGGAACRATDPGCNEPVCTNGGVCTQAPKPDGTYCNDENADTFDDKCKGGKCVGADRCEMVTCLPISPCHNAGACDPATGVCTTPLKPDGAACDDGLATTSGDQCMAGACVGRDRCSGVTCPQRACFTQGRCDPATGRCVDAVPVVDGELCNDGDRATVDDRCTSGRCEGTLQCSADLCKVSNPQCNEAICAAMGGCSERPRAAGTVCDDGNPITVDDVCNGAGMCMGTDKCAMVDCGLPTGGPCLDPPTCDRQTGACVMQRRPDGTVCSDDDDTTYDDTCVMGECVGTKRCEGVVCGVAPDTCHGDGTCNPTTGLCDYPQLPSGTACDDGNVGTSNDVCVAGACTGRLDGCAGTICVASDPRCNTPTCTMNVCGQTPRPDRTVCNDEDPATMDDMCIQGRCVGTNRCTGVICPAPPAGSCTMAGVCDPKLGRCVSEIYTDGTLCDDSDPTTSGDACAAGVCVGTPKCVGVVCQATDNCHDPGVCNPTTGTCSDPLKPDGMPCDDNNMFSTSDTCVNGVCQGQVFCSVGAAMCPNPAQACMAAVCDGNNRCSMAPLPDGTPCNDADAGTTGDVCMAGMCVGTGPCAGVTCPASQCKAEGTCIPALGKCEAAAKPDGTMCDDGDARTLDDMCWRGVCMGTPACERKTCDVATPCMVSRGCDAASGLCLTAPAPDGTLCNDMNPQTQNDKCMAGACAGEVSCGSRTCTAADPRCSTATCAGGACGADRPMADGTPCDDGDDTTTDTCQRGACVGVSRCDGVICRPIDACHEAGKCNPLTGRCTAPLRTDGAPCNDNNPATASSVCRAGACVSDDRCQDVVCMSTSQCHEAGVCDPVTGQCSNPTRVDGTACNDGDDTTRNDQCRSGACAGVALCSGVTCFASDECHDPGMCDPDTGICTDPLRPNFVGCNDGNPATTGDVCMDGVCSGRLQNCGGATCNIQGPVDPACATVACVDSQCVTTRQADGTPCNDNNAATRDDACRDGRCVGVALCASVTCPETQCTYNGDCDAVTGQCSAPAKPDGTACNDGKGDTMNDRCVNGMCTGDAKCNGVVCVALSQCHTQGSCAMDTGLCTTPFKPDGALCDDGDMDTLDDMCMAGVCRGQRVCPNAPPPGTCTQPTSEPQCRVAKCLALGCGTENLPDGTSCDDGDILTFNDMCSTGTCRGRSKCEGITCTQPSQCHQVGQCNPATGVCSVVLQPDGFACNDNDERTVTDQCQDGVCVGRNRCDGVTCRASGPCRRAGACDPLTGTCSSPLAPDNTACDDGNVGTSGDRCVAGVCTGTTECNGQMCTAPDPACNRPVCAAGACSSEVLPDGTPCDDGVPTTMKDACLSGVCVGRDLCESVVCRPASQCHRPPTCDPRTGACLQTPAPDGQGCDDGSADTRGDECRGGVCAGVPKCLDITCPSKGPCYDPGVCDPATGLCSEPTKPAGTPCDDGDATTLQDQCTLGVCVGRVVCGSDVCVAGDARCAKVECDPITGACVETPLADGTFCSDSNPATFGDRCVGGKCVGTSRCEGVVCTPRTVCHAAGTCDPSTGVCSVVLKADFSPCDDGSDLTSDDVCMQGVCAGRNLCSGVVCKASDACHLPGVCQASTGLCTDPPRPGGSACDDMDPNTLNDICTVGACGGVLPCNNRSCSAPNPQCGRPSCGVDGSCEIVPRPDLTPCNDNDPTTINDRCMMGACTGDSRCANVNCRPASQCHDAGVCNPSTGVCSTPFLVDGTACDDGNALTFRDACVQGECVGARKCEGVVCTKKSPCQEVGSCDESSGLCTEPVLPDLTPCNDGDIDTMNDVCRGGVCMGVVTCGQTTCSAGADAACMRVVCDRGMCRQLPKADGIPCSDAAGTLTVNDRCSAGRCVGDDLCRSVSCRSTRPCYGNGTCDPATGQCSFRMAADNTACVTGMTMDPEVCVNGACLPRDLCVDVVCPSAPCSFPAVCQPATGECVYTNRPDNTTCDDGDIATQEDFCAAGKCVGVVLQTCASYSQCKVAKPLAGVISCPRTGCDRATCCSVERCDDYRDPSCRSSTVCPADTGCTDAVCCGTCLDRQDELAGSCTTKEIKRDQICPNATCTTGSCCAAGEPWRAKVQLEFVPDFPRDVDGARGRVVPVLSEVLMVPKDAISDVRVTAGPDNTIRVGMVLTAASRDPRTGGDRDPAVHSAMWQRMIDTDRSLATASRWATLTPGGRAPRAARVYPDTLTYPQQCGSTGEASGLPVLCRSAGGGAGYGCPLNIVCQAGSTPCCLDSDGACDDGTDAVACVSYPKCQAGPTAPIAVCGGSAPSECVGGVTCERSDHLACCCDGDGSCADGDEAVCCSAAGRDVDECTTVCPTCADTGAGNVCTTGTPLGPQLCVEGLRSVLSDWKCACAPPRTGDPVVAGVAECAPPPVGPTDVVITAPTGADLGETAQRVATLTGLPLETVVVTSDGMEPGQARVVLPDETARKDFQEKTALCVDPACRTGSGGSLLGATDIGATKCEALAYRVYCNDKPGCSYNAGAAACETRGAADDGGDDDDGGLPWWAILLIILLVLLCIAAVIMVMNKNKKKDSPSPGLYSPPASPTYKAVDDTMMEPAVEEEMVAPPPPVVPGGGADASPPMGDAPPPMPPATTAPAGYMSPGPQQQPAPPTPPPPRQPGRVGFEEYPREAPPSMPPQHMGASPMQQWGGGGSPYSQQQPPPPYTGYGRGYAPGGYGAGDVMELDSSETQLRNNRAGARPPTGTPGRRVAAGGQGYGGGLPTL